LSEEAAISDGEQDKIISLPIHSKAIWLRPIMSDRWPARPCTRSPDDRATTGRSSVIEAQPRYDIVRQSHPEARLNPPPATIRTDAALRRGRTAQAFHGFAPP